MLVRGILNLFSVLSPPLRRARALYACKAEHDSELSFITGTVFENGEFLTTNEEICTEPWCKTSNQYICLELSLRARRRTSLLRCDTWTSWSDSCLMKPIELDCIIQHTLKCKTTQTMLSFIQWEIEMYSPHCSSKYSCRTINVFMDIKLNLFDLKMLIFVQTNFRLASTLFFW